MHSVVKKLFFYHRTARRRPSRRGKADHAQPGQRRFIRAFTLPMNTHLPPKIKFAIFAAILISVACAVILLRFPESLAAILQLKNLILDHCRNHPISLFVALVILPGLGFPVSALLILAGGIWGSTWQSCAWGIFAMFLNMSWTYWIAAGPARVIVTKLLGKRWDTWKQIDHSNLISLTILLRVAPGIPLCAQNYILGLFAVPYSRYILISSPINSIYVIGFILTGGAIFKGSLGLALIGILILAVAAVIVHFIRNRFKLKNSNSR